MLQLQLANQSNDQLNIRLTPFDINTLKKQNSFDSYREQREQIQSTPYIKKEEQITSKQVIIKENFNILEKSTKSLKTNYWAAFFNRKGVIQKIQNKFINNLKIFTRGFSYSDVNHAFLSILNDKSHPTSFDTYSQGRCQLFCLKNFESITLFNPLSLWMIFWKFLIVIAILYSSLSIILLQSFPANEMTNLCKINWSFTLSITLQLFDILVILNTSIITQGHIIRDRYFILKHYFIDTKIIFKWIIITVFWIISYFYRINQICDANDDNPNNLFGQIAQYLFFFYFLNFQQLMNFFQIIEERFESMKNYFQLIQLLVIVLFLAHLNACILIFTSNYSSKWYGDKNWLNMKGASNSTWDQQYVLSYYFAVTIQTTIGFGDITPQNPLEYGITTIVMLISTGMFGYILNKMSQILEDILQSEQKTNSDLKIINQYMKTRKINQELQLKVQSQIKSMHQNGFNNLEQENKILAELDDVLKNELQIDQKINILKQIPFFFINFSQDFMQSVSLNMKEFKYYPNQILYPINEKKYLPFSIISSGSAQISINFKNKSSQLTSLFRGGYFRLQNLIDETDPRIYKIISKQFSIVYSIEKNEFLKILNDFPLDLEKYQQLKENYLVNKKENILFQIENCLLCRQLGHDIEKCPFIHKRFYKAKVTNNAIKQIPQERQIIIRSFTKSKKVIINHNKFNVNWLSEDQLFDFLSKRINEFEKQQFYLKNKYEPQLMFQIQNSYNSDKRDMNCFVSQSEMVDNNLESLKQIETDMYENQNETIVNCRKQIQKKDECKQDLLEPIYIPIQEAFNYQNSISSQKQYIKKKSLISIMDQNHVQQSTCQLDFQDHFNILEEFDKMREFRQFFRNDNFKDVIIKCNKQNKMKSCDYLKKKKKARMRGLSSPFYLEI